MPAHTPDRVEHAANEDDAYERLPAEDLASEIEHTSPEGRPADPMMSPRRIYLLLALFALMFIVGGVIVALAYDRTVGIGVGVAGVALLALNPTVWAAVSRARERRDAQHTVEAKRDATR